MLSIAVVIHFYCFCTHLPIKWGERISRWGGGKVGKGGKTVERGWENVFPFNFSLHSVCVGTSAGNECIFNANYFLNYIFTLTGAPFVPPSSISFTSLLCHPLRVPAPISLHMYIPDLPTVRRYISEITFITALTLRRLVYFGYFASGPLEALRTVASYGGVADVPANDDPTISIWGTAKVELAGL